MSNTHHLLNRAWGIIANAGWEAQTGRVDLGKTTGWHEAALAWRDDYQSYLSGEAPEPAAQPPITAQDLDHVAETLRHAIADLEHLASRLETP